MTDRMFFSSLTRIADLHTKPFEVAPRPRASWATGDYVVGHVAEQPRGFDRVEIQTGRIAQVGRDALIVGALGVRHATLEATGSWELVEDDGRMHLLTSAGLFGRVGSLSHALPPLLEVHYLGHATRDGEPVRMGDFVEPLPHTPFDVPTIALVGTSMSAGKTTTAKAVIRELKRMGKRVVGSKLTGAGRYRDILSMADAGADEILDFVDAGLPSSILPAEEFRGSLRGLLARIASLQPDVVVAEAGASPLEPYNGLVVVDELSRAVRLRILCASDPYAVVGVMKGFDFTPDLVAGLATSTTAGVELVDKMTGVPALNVLSPDSGARLRTLLEEALDQPG